MKKIIFIIAMMATLSSCDKNKEEITTPTQELMARIGSLEEENKNLKKENSDLKAQLGITEDEENSDQPQDIIQQAEDNPEPKKEGKMIGGTPKGGGKIDLVNASGQGDHIVVIAQNNESLIQVEMYIESIETDGSEPTTIYIDGKEKSIEQLSVDSMSQIPLTLEGKDLKKGIHNVEVIQTINDEQNFYRLLTYEVK